MSRAAGFSTVPLNSQTVPSAVHSETVEINGEDVVVLEGVCPYASRWRIANDPMMNGQSRLPRWDMKKLGTLLAEYKLFEVAHLVTGRNIPVEFGGDIEDLATVSVQTARRVGEEHGTSGSIASKEVQDFEHLVMSLLRDVNIVTPAVGSLDDRWTYERVYLFAEEATKYSGKIGLTSDNYCWNALNAWFNVMPVSRGFVMCEEHNNNCPDCAARVAEWCAVWMVYLRLLRGTRWDKPIESASPVLRERIKDVVSGSLEQVKKRERWLLQPQVQLRRRDVHVRGVLEVPHNDVAYYGMPRADDDEARLIPPFGDEVGLWLDGYRFNYFRDSWVAQGETIEMAEQLAGMFSGLKKDEANAFNKGKTGTFVRYLDRKDPLSEEPVTLGWIRARSVVSKKKILAFFLAMIQAAVGVSLEYPTVEVFNRSVWGWLCMDDLKWNWTEMGYSSTMNSYIVRGDISCMRECSWEYPCSYLDLGVDGTSMIDPHPDVTFIGKWPADFAREGKYLYSPGYVIAHKTAQDVVSWAMMAGALGALFLTVAYLILNLARKRLRSMKIAAYLNTRDPWLAFADRELMSEISPMRAKELQQCGGDRRFGKFHDPSSMYWIPWPEFQEWMVKSGKKVPVMMGDGKYMEVAPHMASLVYHREHPQILAQYLTVQSGREVDPTDLEEAIVLEDPAMAGVAKTMLEKDEALNAEEEALQHLPTAEVYMPEPRRIRNVGEDPSMIYKRYDGSATIGGDIARVTIQLPGQYRGVVKESQIQQLEVIPLAKVIDSKLLTTFLGWDWSKEERHLDNHGRYHVTRTEGKDPRVYREVRYGEIPIALEDGSKRIKTKVFAIKKLIKEQNRDVPDAELTSEDFVWLIFWRKGRASNWTRELTTTSIKQFNETHRDAEYLWKQVPGKAMTSIFLPFLQLPASKSDQVQTINQWKRELGSDELRTPSQRPPIAEDDRFVPELCRIFLANLAKAQLDKVDEKHQVSEFAFAKLGGDTTLRPVYNANVRGQLGKWYYAFSRYSFEGGQDAPLWIGSGDDDANWARGEIDGELVAEVPYTTTDIASREVVTGRIRMYRLNPASVKIQSAWAKAEGVVNEMLERGSGVFARLEELERQATTMFAMLSDDRKQLDSQDKSITRLQVGCSLTEADIRRVRTEVREFAAIMQEVALWGSTLASSKEKMPVHPNEIRKRATKLLQEMDDADEHLHIFGEGAEKKASNVADVKSHQKEAKRLVSTETAVKRIDTSECMGFEDDMHVPMNYRIQCLNSEHNHRVARHLVKKWIAEDRRPALVNRQRAKAMDETEMKKVYDSAERSESFKAWAAKIPDARCLHWHKHRNEKELREKGATGYWCYVHEHVIPVNLGSEQGVAPNMDEYYPPPAKPSEAIAEAFTFRVKLPTPKAESQVNSFAHVTRELEFNRCFRVSEPFEFRSHQDGIDVVSGSTANYNAFFGDNRTIVLARDMPICVKMELGNKSVITKCGPIEIHPNEHMKSVGIGNLAIPVEGVKWSEKWNAYVVEIEKPLPGITRLTTHLPSMSPIVLLSRDEKDRLLIHPGEVKAVGVELPILLAWGDTLVLHDLVGYSCDTNEGVCGTLGLQGNLGALHHVASAVEVNGQKMNLGLPLTKN